MPPVSHHGYGIACRKRSRSVSVSVTRNAFASTSPLTARSQHSLRSQRYAPRPLSLPLGSTDTPSSLLTTRKSVRLASFSRQTTQLRRGTCLRLGAVFPFIIRLSKYPL